MNEKPMTDQEIQEQREFAEEMLKEVEMELESKAEDKNVSIENIWYVGMRISVGCGFWGSFNLLGHRNPKLMVKAWVDGLRELGYTDKQIVCYGDWSDGRHIADNIEKTTSYDEFKSMVMKSARDPKKFDPSDGYSRVDKYSSFLKVW